MTVARLVRAQTLKLRELEFVVAAKSLGLRDWRIILFHILPSILPAVVVDITLNVGQTILFESALSFLGLGIQPPLASWGSMLNNGLEALSMSPAMVFYPGFMILIIVVSFNFLGDGMGYALDPQSHKR
jgi:peptide/nickel transport system permease protein